MKRLGLSVVPIVILFFFSIIGLGSGAISTVESNGGTTGGNVKLPIEVLKWKEKVVEEAEKNGVPEIVNSILAIIAVETGGNADQYPDIMQCSESQGRPPNSIQDPNESIEVGVKYFATMYKKYKTDVWNVTQAYNYGEGYLLFAGKTYSFDEAIAFSNKMANGEKVMYVNAISTKLGYDYRYNYGNMFYVALCQQFFETDVGEAEGEYSMPIENPILSSGFSNRVSPITGLPEYHLGLDFANPYGSPIKASKSGKVVIAEYHFSYGNYIVIEHGDETWTAYGHQSKLIAGVGDSVAQGDVIGEIGSTGDSTGPHLHFEIRRSLMGDQVDPAPFLGV